MDIGEKTDCTFIESTKIAKHPILIEFERVCEPYIFDPKYVFKSTEDSLIVLEKLPSTLTNQMRTLTENGDPNYAKYRANELKVIVIFDRYNPSETKEKTNSIFKKTFAYESGKIVKALSYGEKELNEKYFEDEGNNERVCTFGIHYYKTIEAAFYHQIDVSHLNGYVFVRNGDGVIIKRKEYIEGKIQEIRYSNGNLECKYNYVDGKKNGQVEAFYEDGSIKARFSFIDDKKNGICEDFHNNGTLKRKYNYVDDKMSGDHILFFENGRKRSECQYIDGKKNGVETKWRNIINLGYSEARGDDIVWSKHNYVDGVLDGK